MENEIWVDIPGYEDMYSVSNLGRVKSLDRKTNHPRKDYCIRKGKELKQHIINGGYLHAELNKNGNSRRFLIHRLVMYAFKGFSTLHVDHINGINTDNRLENLRYCTIQENNRWQASKNKTGKSSRFLGVTWNKGRRKWEAKIQINKTCHHLGLFDSEVKASCVYREKLKSVSSYDNLVYNVITPP